MEIYQETASGGPLWTNYSDFYQNSGYGLFPQEHRAAPGRLGFRMIKVDQGPHAFRDPTFPETILALPLEVESHCNVFWSMDGRRHKQRAEAGRMLVIPADTESQWEVDGARKILVLMLPNKTVRSILGPSCPYQIGPAFSKLSLDTWEDGLIQVLMNRLWDCARGSEQADPYLSDGLLTSILSQLLINAGVDLCPNNAIALPQWRFKRVREFVQSNLDRELSLNELADAAGLSRRHFARSFRQEIGTTPHRWLMQARLHKAKQMLSETDDLLYAIAEQCGFSSQSHLITAFKQDTGMTPNRWRNKFRKED